MTKIVYVLTFVAVFIHAIGSAPTSSRRRKTTTMTTPFLPGKGSSVPLKTDSPLMEKTSELPASPEEKSDVQTSPSWTDAHPSKKVVVSTPPLVKVYLGTTAQPETSFHINETEVTLVQTTSSSTATEPKTSGPSQSNTPHQEATTRVFLKADVPDQGEEVGVSLQPDMSNHQDISEASSQTATPPTRGTSVATEKPVEADRQLPKDEEITTGAFQGDMMLTFEQMREVIAAIDDQQTTPGRTKRKATSNMDHMWTGGVIPYVIAQSSANNAGVIREAMDQWEMHTCLRFKPRNSSHSTYISFFKGTGCWSVLGRALVGEHRISIGNGCAQLGTVLHEIGHVIGFHHEQSRPDRDDFVMVHYENIVPGLENQFAKYSWGEITTRGVGYDVSSIMHYDEYAFSSNGMPTISTNDPLDAAMIGQRVRLSFADIKLANLMYHCSDHCENIQWTRCRNGGYLGPDCDCLCPPGFGGERCETVDEEGAAAARGCVHRLTDREGEISSPNFPANYDNHVHCLYLIEGSPGATIELTFHDFVIEFHALCRYDSVEIRTDDVHYPGQKYCGNKQHLMVTSMGYQMLVDFTSDYSETRRGFHASYIIIGGNSTSEVDDGGEDYDVSSSSIGIDEFEGTCGGHFVGVGDETGTLASPNYPGNYHNNLQCVYTITVEEGRRVQLRIFDLALENQQGCAWDALTVKLGHSVKVPMAFCGTDFPDAPIVSIGNTMEIVLKTDTTSTYRGFAAVYRAID